MESLDLSVRVGNDITEPATVVRDLGVLLDSELSLKTHISNFASVCNFHLYEADSTYPWQADSNQSGQRFRHQSVGLFMEPETVAVIFKLMC